MPRKKVLIPDSAHGTNPASVVIAGYEVQNIKSNARGQIDTDHLREFATEDVAALMVTNPSTLGVFEERIAEIAAILHERGALLYMDGANMNALAGVARPGDFGVDVMHLNLHKTFSTPHGGGGPGAGRCWRRKFSSRSCRSRWWCRKDGSVTRSITIGRNRSGACAPIAGISACCCARWPTRWPTARASARPPKTPCSMRTTFARTSKSSFDLPYNLPSMHEVVFSDARQKKHGVNTMDIAKRLIDYGFHPYTTAFPLIVPGAMMIEPTESESKEECDLFIDAMRSIAAGSRNQSRNGEDRAALHARRPPR